MEANLEERALARGKKKKLLNDLIMEDTYLL